MAPEVPLPKAIEAAAEGLDWAAARALFSQYEASPERRWRRTGLLAASLLDWLAVLRAEAGHMAELEIADPGGLSPKFGRISTLARLRLNLTEDALDLARAYGRRFPEQQIWAKTEAKALSLLGDHEAALAIGIKAWRAGRDFGAPLAAEALIALGQMEECGRFLEQAEHGLAGADRGTPLARARIAYWAEFPDPVRGLAGVMDLAGQMPDAEYRMAVARQAARARDPATLDALLAEVAAWAEDRARDALFRLAGPAILEAHFFCLFDWQAVRPWTEGLARRILTPGPARALSRLLMRAGEYRLVDAVAALARQWFPSALSMGLLQLQVLSLLGDQARLAEVRRQIKAAFPARSYLATMSRASPRVWDLDDLPELLVHNLASRDGEQQARFFMSLGEAALSEEQVELLRAAAPAASPLIRAQAEMMLSPLADRRLLESAILAPVNFAAFDQSRARTEDRVAQITEEIAPADGGDAASGFGMPECLRLVAILQGRPFPVKISTRESYAEAAALVGVIVDRIARREATSVIRIGDGEGHFLPAHATVTGHRAADRAAIQDVWWGSRRMVGRRLKSIEGHFLEAVDNASILALIPPWRFIAEMAKSKASFAHRGILSGVSHCATMDFRGALMTSMHFPNDLHKWNLWPEIFAAVRSVSYISCHQMAPFLRDTFGVETRQAIHIPAEHKYAALFDEKADQPGAGDTLLDRHDAVCAALDPLPGEVFLVAAGFLGKIYCEIVRQKGGVAIDIGSLADYWMGFATRRYRLEQLSEIGLPNAFIEDHLLAPPRDHARIAGPAPAVRSTADCRYNIADAADEALAGAAPGQRALLRVLGHPRCASAYMATVFTGLGLEIGHEKLLRDGISSWMHAAADLHVPYGHNASTGVDFAHTVAHVRDPADAVSSIMLENGRSRSFNFRRLHILRAVGVDLCDYGAALDRAVASLVHWYDMVMALRPEAVFKIEDAEHVVRDWLARTDLVSVASRAAAAPRPAPSAGASDADFAAAIDPEDQSDFVDVANVNNSVRKFGRAKPTLTPDSYSTLDPDLRARLAAYCERFGYDCPW
ncbi:MAG: hypothetical protein ABI306_03305 [Caulobacteraceae bacterium]